MFEGEMSCNKKIPLLIFLILTSLFFSVHARTLLLSSSKAEMEEKLMLRGQIGSRPPRCQRRCNSCQHCDAIQVPTNPQRKNGNDFAPSSSSRSDRTSARSDDNYSSNYKPMSWKCKCGDLIFNP